MVGGFGVGFGVWSEWVYILGFYWWLVFGFWVFLGGILWFCGVGGVGIIQIWGWGGLVFWGFWVGFEF